MTCNRLNVIIRYRPNRMGTFTKKTFCFYGCQMSRRKVLFEVVLYACPRTCLHILQPPFCPCSVRFGVLMGKLCVIVAVDGFFSRYFGPEDGVYFFKVPDSTPASAEEMQLQLPASAKFEMFGSSSWDPSKGCGPSSFSVYDDGRSLIPPYKG